MPEERSIFDQSLAVCNNYYLTGQKERGDELWAVLERIAPDHPIIKKGIASDPTFFGKFWRGESLDGKSIEIFCDQGMGDVINMLRYVEEIKRRWPSSKTILNCHAHYECLKRLMGNVPYVDQFVNYHCVSDYCSNIFSIPTILSGIKLEVPYPAHFKYLLEKGVPYQTPINIGTQERKMRVGVAWKSNANNELAKIKSMDLMMVKVLTDDRWLLYSLLPENTGVDFLIESPLVDLQATAELIAQMDVVVSVDTAVLHLSGALNKKTYALLAKCADPRWEKSAFTLWYPSVRQFRQTELDDWLQPLESIKQNLDLLYREIREIGFLHGSVSGGFYG